MPTYYEQLGVSPDASVEEIRQAYADRYDALRQRAERHHDPAERLKAEEQRLELEKAIVVLTDPAKRAEYDATLGMTSRGRLVDPDAPMPDADRVGAPPPTPPPVRPHTDVRVDAWVCPRCQHPNPIGTRYCQKCREQIGVDCPNCGTTVQATAKYCPNCGIEIRSALEEQEREKEKLRQLEMEERLFHLQRQLRNYQREGKILQ